MTVKLQGIYNKQEAKAVKELKTGDVIMWNYGYTSTVVDLIPSKTGKTIIILHGRHCCRPERMVNDYENRYCYLQQVQWFWQIHL